MYTWFSWGCVIIELSCFFIWAQVRGHMNGWRTLPHNAAITTVDWHPTLPIFLTGSADNSVRVTSLSWDDALFLCFQLIIFSVSWFLRNLIVVGKSFDYQNGSWNGLLYPLPLLKVSEFCFLFFFFYFLGWGWMCCNLIYSIVCICIIM